MYTSRMRTVHCSGSLSCHACHPPLMHVLVMHSPSPALHFLHHACHTPMHTPSSTHARPGMHTPMPQMPPPLPHTSPLPCMPLFTMHTPFMTHAPCGQKGMIHACESITFPQLLLRRVKNHSNSTDIKFFQ